MSFHQLEWAFNSKTHRFVPLLGKKFAETLSFFLELSSFHLEFLLKCPLSKPGLVFSRVLPCSSTCLVCFQWARGQSDEGQQLVVPLLHGAEPPPVQPRLRRPVPHLGSGGGGLLSWGASGGPWPSWHPGALQPKLSGGGGIRGRGSFGFPRFSGRVIPEVCSLTKLLKFIFSFCFCVFFAINT